MPLSPGKTMIRGDETPTKRVSEDARRKIPVAIICSRLARHVQGKLKMSNTQIRAADILLKKCMPDLQSLQLDTGSATGLAELLAAAAKEKEKQIVGEVLGYDDSPELPLNQLDNPDIVIPDPPPRQRRKRRTPEQMEADRLAKEEEKRQKREERDKLRLSQKEQSAGNHGDIPDE